LQSNVFLCKHESGLKDILFTEPFTGLSHIFLFLAFPHAVIMSKDLTHSDVFLHSQNPCLFLFKIVPENIQISKPTFFCKGGLLC